MLRKEKTRNTKEGDFMVKLLHQFDLILHQHAFDWKKIA